MLKNLRYTMAPVPKWCLHKSGTLRLARGAHHIPISRSVDKVHRKIVHSLQRDITKYNKSKIVIEPTIQHFFVHSHLASTSLSQGTNVKISKNVIPQPFKPSKLLEPILFHILCLFNDPNPTIKDNIVTIARKLNAPKDLEDVSKLCRDKYGIDLDHVTEAVIQSFSLPEDTNSLKIALWCFFRVSRIANTEYTENDLIQWMKSVTSENVTQACSSLTNLIDIPGFISGDILLRTPMSKDELQLQLDLWRTFMKAIRAEYHHKVSHLRTIFNNLVFYTTHLDVNQLPLLIDDTCKVYFDTKSSHHTKLLDSNYIDQLMWSLPFDYIESPMVKSSDEILLIVKGQEILSRYVKAKDGTPNLSLTGHMGVVLAISYISKEKAKSLFNISRDKHFSRRHKLARKEMMTFHFVRVLLSETPDELLHAFNEAAIDSKHNSTLWLGFIKKLISFELLTPERSEQVLVKLLEISHELLITKNIVLHLLIPLTTPAQLSSFVLVFASNQVFIRFRSILVEKYMNVLYNNLNSPVDQEMVTKLFNNKSVGEDSLSVARTIYHHHINRKTAVTIGRMMNGEVKVQPENIYPIYKQELSKYQVLADESCLMALLKASLKLSTTDTSFVWQDMYPPQIAVHEFKIHVNRPHFRPSNELWQMYIRVLLKFGYISQLSEIMEWWQNLHFTPNHYTLLSLLKALPLEFSHRHISHIAKVKREAHAPQYPAIGSQGNIDWPWPTLEDLVL